MLNSYDARETWLRAAVDAMRPVFATHGATVPNNIHVSCGFPSVGGRNGLKRQRIGECWAETASKDGSFEIFISPTLADPMKVLSVLGHEVNHATVGLAVGHRGQFKRLALAIGLIGKMTATEAGDEFKRTFTPVLESLGPYPHAELDTRRKRQGPGEPWLSSGPAVQGTRLLKVMCPGPQCGYPARVTQKWLDEVGPPLCPRHGPMVRQL